jgi:hypothetical protein
MVPGGSNVVAFFRFFAIITLMQIEINSRGSCRVQDTIMNARAIFTNADDPMELVVYSCPKFQETSGDKRK